MEAIIHYIRSVDLDYESLIKTALILLLVTFLVSVFGRFIFGKRSALNNASSSAIAILFIYAATVILQSIGAQFAAFTAPLPFVSITGDQLHIISFEGADYTVICAELLSMIILSFLVNITDGWLPRGKNIFTWVFFRCITVIAALFLHVVASELIKVYLPSDLLTYAPVILLAILIVLLLTGALKVVVGALLTTVNPVIGGLYTFFFATIIGKQITKAVLTTTILSGIVCLLNYVDCTVISINDTALVAYIPFIAVLIIVWYVVGKIF